MIEDIQEREYRKPFSELAQEYIPFIYSLIDSETWDVMESKMDEKVTELEKALKTNLKVQTELSISVLLAEASRGPDISNNYIVFLSFINNKIESIYNNIDSNFQIDLISMIKRLMKEGDIKVLEYITPQYLNWIAEFLVLDMFLQKKNITLIDIERDNENGRSMDFVIETNNITLYIDVVTVHIRGEAAINMENLKRTIEGKIEGKIVSKKISDLEDNYIMPIFSFDESNKESILNYLRSTTLSCKVIEPYYIAQYTDGEIMEYKMVALN